MCGGGGGGLKRFNCSVMSCSDLLFMFIQSSVLIIPFYSIKNDLIRAGQKSVG